MRCRSTRTHVRSRHSVASPGAASTTTCAPPWTRCSVASSAPSTLDSRPCAATSCSTPTSATSPRAGERGSGEELAGQPQAHLDRSRDPSLRLVHRTHCLAERAASFGVERHHASAPPIVHRGRDLGVGEASPHVHAGPLQRLRRAAGLGQQHLPGGRRAQPLLRAVRVGRPHRQHPRLSRTNRCGGRRCRRSQPCPAAGQWADRSTTST